MDSDKGGIFNQNEAGFTLAEVVATVGFSVVIAAMAVIGSVDLLGSFRQSSALKQVASDMRRAKAEAVAAGALGVISLVSGNSGYAFGLDHAPFSTPPASDLPVFVSNLPPDVTLAVSQQIVFDSRGFLVDSVGDLTTSTLSLELDGDAFSTITIYPTGMVEY